MENNLKDLIDNQDFSDKLKEAAACRFKIINDLKPEFEDLRKDWIDTLILADFNGVKVISERLKQDKHDTEAKDQMRSWKKDVSKIFKNLVKCCAPGHDRDGNPRNPPIAVVAKYGTWLKYLELDEIISSTLSETGAKLNFQPLVEKHPELDSDNTRAALKIYINDASDIHNKVIEESDKIKYSIFESLDNNLIYDRSENPSGLKPTNFNKLATTRAYSIIKNADQFKAYIGKQIEENVSNIEREDLVLHKNKEF